jgi:mitogen-activated protein kinase kinase kinase
MIDSDPAERPTAGVLKRQPFCFLDPNYNFFDYDIGKKMLEKPHMR